MPNHLDRMRALLGRHGAQAEVAQMTGIPLRSIRAYRSGQAEPPHDRFEQIVEALGKVVVLVDRAELD